MYEARWRWAHCRVSLQRRRWDECHLSRQRRFRDNCSGKRNWLTQRRRRDCQSLRSGHKKRMHPYRGSGRRGGDCETMSMNSIGATCKGGAMTINWGALSINWGTVTVSVRTAGGGDRSSVSSTTNITRNNTSCLISLPFDLVGPKSHQNCISNRNTVQVSETPLHHGRRKSPLRTGRSKINMFGGIGMGLAMRNARVIGLISVVTAVVRPCMNGLYKRRRGEGGVYLKPTAHLGFPPWIERPEISTSEIHFFWRHGCGFSSR